MAFAAAASASAFRAALAIDLAACEIVLAEGAEIDGFCRFEARVELRGVGFSTHPEIREMVNEFAEDAFAVIGVGLGVQDVLVPEGVDVLRRNDAPVPIDEHHAQEAAVAGFRVVDVFLLPARPFIGVHELKLDHRKVDGVHFFARNGESLLTAFLPKLRRSECQVGPHFTDSILKFWRPFWGTPGNEQDTTILDIRVYP